MREGKTPPSLTGENKTFNMNRGEKSFPVHYTKQPSYQILGHKIKLSSLYRHEIQKLEACNNLLASPMIGSID